MLNHPIKAIVVDDEQPSRQALVTYIIDYCQGVEVVAQCDSVKTAYQAILKHDPHLVFLDIEMPNGNGFDLLHLFKSPGFRIIFVTAYSQYAVDAFRFSATDYLLKPVKVDELIEAVNRVAQSLNGKPDGQNLNALIENLSYKDGSLSNLVISDLKGYTVVKIPELIKCEGEGYCTHFYLTDKTKVTSSKNLKYYEELLSQQSMIRVHHSWLVNLHHVKGFTRQGEILMSEGQSVPLGTSYKIRFMDMISKLR